MNGNVVMKAKDTVFAALAECFVTIGTRRYNFRLAAVAGSVTVIGGTGRAGEKGTGGT